MIELRGIESNRARDANLNPRCQYYIQPKEGVELKAGDEVLVTIERQPELKHEEYGLALRVTDKSEPEEGEFIVQYGDRLFIGQKLPEFI